MTTELQPFTEKQLSDLNKPLDPRFISNRKGGGNTTLKYIEGHDAIDQANRIFGHGRWTYRPLSCVQTVLIDPLTGEAVGVTYKAQVELTVAGCIAPLVEVGSQPVATWNVEDHIMGRRRSDAKYNKKPVDTGEFTPDERKAARAVIVDAHEMAEKGAVTDALKRALRTFGDQFGNGLYGDGRIPMAEEEPVPPKSSPETRQAPRPVQPPVAIGTAASKTAQDRVGAAYTKAKERGVVASDMTREGFLAWMGQIVHANITNVGQMTESRLQAVEELIDQHQQAS